MKLTMAILCLAFSGCAWSARSDWRFFQRPTGVEVAGWAACATLVAIDDVQTADFRQRGFHEINPVSRAFLGRYPKSENIAVWSGLGFVAYSAAFYVAPPPIRKLMLAGCIGAEGWAVTHNAGASW